MAAYIEVLKPAGREVVVLEATRVTIGKGPANDVVLDFDATVSRLHASLEAFGSGWAVRDLGSRNGTFVNGERIIGDRALRAGDEVRVGTTRLVFKSAVDGVSATQAATPAPQLTRRERDVLVALCRPVFAGAVFTEPASIKEIAAELVVTEATVKEYLGRLYDKFGIHEGDRRRVRLANEAIQRGAVSMADLRLADGS